MLTDSQINAILNLAKDSDASVRQSLDQQLLKLSTSELEQLANSCLGPISENFDKLRRQRHFAAMETGLEKILHDASIPSLEELVIYLTRYLIPNASVSKIRAQLDQLTIEAKQYLDADSKVMPRGYALVNFLANQSGFSGKKLSSYQPEFCTLDFVLREKTGLPISLVCLYIIMGQRLNIPVKALALPGYFIISICEKNQKPIYFDPFRGGVCMSAGNIYEFAERFDMPNPEICFEPISDKDVFYDLLNHVRFLYKRNRQSTENEAMKRILKLWKEHTIDN